MQSQSDPRILFNRPTKLALTWFLISCSVFFISFFSVDWFGHSDELWTLNWWGPAFYFCLLNFVLRYCHKGFDFEVSLRSSFLGATFALGLYLSTLNSSLHLFGLYTLMLTIFHFSEFLSVALFNSESLSVDSFILNHSVQYGVAAVSSWVEFGLEYYFFSGMKSFYMLAYVGLALCIMGEFLRKAAMYTARKNFNHLVQFEKSPDHKLVTHGVYSLFRHPSYVGWFYWSIGTQLLLLNPVCVIAYTLASWSFFNERIYAEEATLLTFFGLQYKQYQDKVPIGLPYIEGYRIDM